jgi:hypothetical protein
LPPQVERFVTRRIRFHHNARVWLPIDSTMLKTSSITTHSPVKSDTSYSDESARQVNSFFPNCDKCRIHSTLPSRNKNELFYQTEHSSGVLQCSHGLSNKVSNIIRRLMDNMKLLLICILRVLLSHSFIFFSFYFLSMHIWFYSCLIM